MAVDAGGGWLNTFFLGDVEDRVNMEEEVRLETCVVEGCMEWGGR